MKRKLAWAVAIMVGAALLIPLLAGASHVEVADPDDADGFLDIRTVRVTDVDDPVSPRWKIVTYAEWSVERLWDKGFLFIYFDTFGTERADYYVVVRSGDGRKMSATLRRDRARKRDYTIAELDPSRPDRFSVAVRVPLGKMTFGDQRLAYRWFVQSLVTSPRCSRVCFDRAPDQAAVTEPRPGASPSPSPTLTIVPSITPSGSPSPSPSSSP